MTDKDPSEILNIISRIENISAYPKVSLEVFKLAKDPSSNMEQIARVILQDSIITAQLLKLANSVQYFRGKSIKTITDTIITLGLDTVKNLVMAIEMIGLFKGSFNDKTFNDETFFKSSFAGALLCNRIAIECKLEDTESPYICGLLRDFGIIILRQYFSDVFTAALEIIKNRSASFYQAINDIAFFDHRFIAYLLFIRWNMPTTVVYTFRDSTPLLHDHAECAMIRKIVLYTDWLLHEENYAQWDTFYTPSKVIIPELPPESPKIKEIITSAISEVNDFSSHVF